MTGPTGGRDQVKRQQDGGPPSSLGRAAHRNKIEIPGASPGTAAAGQRGRR